MHLLSFTAQSSVVRYYCNFLYMHKLPLKLNNDLSNMSSEEGIAWGPNSFQATHTCVPGTSLL